MFRYLQSAFFLRVAVPLLGAIPLNVIATIAFGILGIAHPAFWLLGAGLETAYLFTIASNARFQRYVEALDTVKDDDQAEDKRQALIKQLDSDARDQLVALETKCAKVIELTQTLQGEDFTLDGNREALRKLIWIYLKLLIARQYLRSQASQATEAHLRQQTDGIQKELSARSVSPAIRESKNATLAILQKRLENLQRREESMKEIESDLTRIEAQIDLAVEDATIRGQPRQISSNIDLVTHMLDLGCYGSSESTIADLDASFAKTT